MKSLAAVCVAALVLVFAPAVQSAESPAADRLAAKSTEPIVVVSFAGYSRLVEDINYVGTLMDNPGLATGLEFMLNLATQGRGAQGIDKDRPWGAAGYLNADTLEELQAKGDQGVRGFVFVPVTDFDAVRQTLERLEVQIKKLDDGVLQVGKEGEKPVFVKQAGKWAYLSAAAEMLADVPEDPAKLLQDLPKQYDLAVRFNTTSISKDLREAFWKQVEQQARSKSQPQRPDESDEQYAGRKLGQELAMGWIKTLWFETEQFTLGLQLDSKAGQFYLDGSLTALPDTSMARQFAKLEKTRNEYPGFIRPNAVGGAHCVGELSLLSKEQRKTFLDIMRKSALQSIDRQQMPEDKAKAAQEALTKALQLVEQWAMSDRSGGAMSVVAEPEKLQGLLALAIDDGKKFEKSLKDLAETIRRQEPAKLEQVWKPEVDKQGEVSFHKIVVPVPDDAKNREQLVKMIGATIEVVIGIGPKDIYVAAGKEPLEALKQAIVASKQGEKDALPMKAWLDAGTLAKFIAAVEENPAEAEQAARVAKALEQAGNKDRVILSATPIPGGLRFRWEVESGILKALVKMRQQGGMR